MNTAEFLASLESSATVGLDDLNYDSFWDHSATQDTDKAEEEVQEVVAEDAVVEVIERGDETLCYDDYCYPCFNLNDFKICIV